jgi:hypothetical protein
MGRHVTRHVFPQSKRAGEQLMPHAIAALGVHPSIFLVPFGPPNQRLNMRVCLLLGLIYRNQGHQELKTYLSHSQTLTVMPHLSSQTKLAGL